MPHVIPSLPNSALRDAPDMRIKIAAHVRSTGDGDGYVLLDLDKGLYHSIDGVSARIWSGLLAGDAPARISGEISELCNVPVERVGRDMMLFVQSLHAKGLVTIDV